MKSFKDRVGIIGMGCTQFGELWDKGLEDLAIEAAYEAYEDSGVDPKDIEVCFYGTSTAPVVGVAGANIADSLKLKDIPIIRNENWCTTGHVALWEACMSVAAGIYDVAMAIGVEKLNPSSWLTKNYSVKAACCRMRDAHFVTTSFLAILKRWS